MKTKIDIIGKGNVGSHLVEAYKGIMDVRATSSRDLRDVRPDADLHIVCVSDDAIREIFSELSCKVSGSSVIAHTSGTTPLSAISDLHTHTGVFYPLQTFTKGKPLDYSRIPFFIEASDSKSEDLLMKVASAVSDSVSQADSEKRLHLHIASVMSCNFVNHLWTLSERYLSSNGIEFRTLLPLIEETFRKVTTMNPKAAQTGPASRHDLKTIDSHLAHLEESPDIREIYRILTSSIMASAQKIQNK